MEIKEFIELVFAKNKIQYSEEETWKEDKFFFEVQIKTKLLGKLGHCKVAKYAPEDSEKIKNEARAIFLAKFIGQCKPDLEEAAYDKLAKLN